MRPLLLLACLCLLLTACGEQPAEPLQAQVEARLFSGRQNPSWSMSAEEAAELERRLAALPQTQLWQPAELLGYSGFSIYMRRGELDPSFEQSVLVYQDKLLLERAGTTLFLHDEGRTIERWLVEQAGQYLTPQELEALRSGVGLP